jgi:hypothetical protein
MVPVRMRPLAALMAALLAVFAAAGAARAQDENPTTPGAIPNPGTYQGSMELQRQEHQQQQQYYQQQRQPEYYPNQPSRGYSPGYAPRGPAMAPNADAAAFNRGDYATAYRLTVPNAMRGQRVAQHNLGMLYANGWGAPRDYAQAAYWYRKSAAQGYPNAANDLAMMYGRGLGVPRDNVQAYVWFTRGVSYATNARDRDAIVNNRNFMIARMTPAELAEARRLTGGGVSRVSHHRR